MTTAEREIGALQARMETVEYELQAIRQDVRAIRDFLVGIKSGWKFLAALIGLSLSCGIFLGKFFSLISLTRS